MIARTATAIAVGTLATMGLLYLMQALISLQPTVVSDPRTHLTLGRVKLPEPPKPIMPPEPIDPEKLTRSTLPPRWLEPAGDGPSIGVKIPTQTAPTCVSCGPTLQQNADGPLVAMIRVSPSYPPIASARGLEGYVIVQFDVMTDGLVENVVVIESSHSAFERNAIKAAERFKFKPRVVDGEPQISRSIMNQFTFTLDDVDNSG